MSRRAIVNPARALAAWWGFLARLRERVYVATQERGGSTALQQRAWKRQIIAGAEEVEWTEQYRPLSEQRWERLVRRRDERLVLCVHCKGRRLVRNNVGGKCVKRTCLECNGTGERGPQALPSSGVSSGDTFDAWLRDEP